MSNYAEQVKVYPLLDPSHYLDNQELLATILFPDIRENRGKKFFSVSPSGFISFSDYNELWNENVQRRKLSTNADEASEAAICFIEQAHANFMDKSNQTLNEKLVALPFPSFSSLPEVVPVPHPYEPVIDHWLCRFEADICCSECTGCIPVHGALCEVRVGDAHKVIGLNIRWRPVISGGFDTTLLPYEVSKKKGRRNKIPDLVYVLDSENQKFLAPFYLTINNGYPSFSPASEYSIVADIFQWNTSSGANLYASVNGGNMQKKFSFRWAMNRVDKLLDEGLKMLSTSSILRNIPFGVYNISLDVCDTINGQTKRLWKKVHISSNQEFQV